MRPIPRSSLPERVAAHLREGIRLGRWSDPFPGVQQLAAELDVARHTVRRALQILEDQGVLDWCHPPIARMQWDSTPIARNVVHWVNAVRKGNPGRKINDVTAEFLPGGSIGPVGTGKDR